MTKPDVEDFSRAQQTSAAASGRAPELVRAPYGVRWFGFNRMQRELNLKGVMWTVIGLDWKLPGAWRSSTIPG